MEQKKLSQEEKIKQLYEIDPQAFDAFSKREDSGRNLQKVLSAFDFCGKVVLDMGAGTGRFSSYVIDKVGHLICSDSSEAMVRYLRESGLIGSYAQKVTLVHCDHLALPSVIPKWCGKVDYIIAGYSIGSYFNRESITDEQKAELVASVLRVAGELLVSGGKMLIVESLGIQKEDEEIKLLAFDDGLAFYYDLLDRNGFQKTVVDTSFCFESEREAVRVIQSFWGKEASDKIEPKGGCWILREYSAVWTKTFD